MIDHLDLDQRDVVAVIDTGDKRSILAASLVLYPDRGATIQWCEVARVHAHKEVIEARLRRAGKRLIERRGASPSAIQDGMPAYRQIGHCQYEAANDRAVERVKARAARVGLTFITDGNPDNLDRVQVYLQNGRAVPAVQRPSDGPPLATVTLRDYRTLDPNGPKVDKATPWMLAIDRTADGVSLTFTAPDGRNRRVEVDVDRDVPRLTVGDVQDDRPGGFAAYLTDEHPVLEPNPGPGKEHQVFFLPYIDDIVPCDDPVDPLAPEGTVAPSP